MTRIVPPTLLLDAALTATAGVDPEYLELRSPDDLTPAARVNGRALLAVAARVGSARLIDNTILGDEATRGDA